MGGVFPPLWKPCCLSWVLTLAVEGVFLDLLFFLSLCFLSSVLVLLNNQGSRAKATYELGVSKLSWECRSFLQLGLYFYFIISTRSFINLNWFLGADPSPGTFLSVEEWVVSKVMGAFFQDKNLLIWVWYCIVEVLAR